MIKEKLLIIGAGGHGKVCADIAINMGKWKEIAFLDDRLFFKKVMGLNVIGKVSEYHKYADEYEIFVGIGDNFARQNILNELKELQIKIPKLIHPSAVIGTEVTVGEGTVIMAGVVINCCTRIGIGGIINTAATIDHDNIIDNFVHISPGAHLAGNVKVGEKTWIGIGGTVKNNITISKNVIIGAGATVIKDLTSTGTYIGLPARREK